MILDNVGRDRGGEDEGKIDFDSKGLRKIAEVIIKASGHNRTSSSGFPVSLGDPNGRGRHRRGQRPNNRAIVVFQNEGLKARTKARSKMIRQRGHFFDPRLVHRLDADLVGGGGEPLQLPACVGAGRRTIRHRGISSNTHHAEAPVATHTDP